MNDRPQERATDLAYFVVVPAAVIAAVLVAMAARCNQRPEAPAVSAECEQACRVLERLDCDDVLAHVPDDRTCPEHCDEMTSWFPGAAQCAARIDSCDDLGGCYR